MSTINPALDVARKLATPFKEFSSGQKQSSESNTSDSENSPGKLLSELSAAQVAAASTAMFSVIDAIVGKNPLRSLGFGNLVTSAILATDIGLKLTTPKEKPVSKIEVTSAQSTSKVSQNETTESLKIEPVSDLDRIKPRERSSLALSIRKANTSAPDLNVTKGTGIRPLGVVTADGHSYEYGRTG